MDNAVMPRYPAQELSLSTVEYLTLQRWITDPTAPPQLRTRCRIVLACARGATYRRAAAELGVQPKTVARWRNRFVRERLAGLDDLPRTGRPRNGPAPAGAGRTAKPAPRRSNPALRALMAEAGWTAADLAHAVRRTAADVYGLDLRCGHTTVKRWRRGAFDHTVPLRVITTAVSQRLGRDVSPTDIGALPHDTFSPSPPPPHRTPHERSHGTRQPHETGAHGQCDNHVPGTTVRERTTERPAAERKHPGDGGVHAQNRPTGRVDGLSAPSTVRGARQSARERDSARSGHDEK